ncbi:hypothetical protein [Thalassospira sp.]|uniref:hypothetical protein n=1 Tax=Thalassospira sp. TaxID=1912094 RepID=UPI0027355D3B|nr:hypothetical protein [Thalassospira sp.]MDP2699483.1 hypothetical protein [Thalassospira sp.]
MTMRTLTKTVTFSRRFSLRGLAEVLPSGAYSVTTIQELPEGVTYPVYRTVSTQIQLQGDAGDAGRLMTIDPRDLETAILQDQRSLDAREKTTGRQKQAIRSPRRRAAFKFDEMDKNVRQA